MQLLHTKPRSSEMEYHGWSWIGLHVVRLYFASMTIEITSLLLFCRFGICRTRTFRFSPTSVADTDARKDGD
jgi:hypothetical protein